MFRTPLTKARRASPRRAPSLENLIFEMGGVSGATRRIVNGWRMPFTANQLKIELRRRHPELIPGDDQVEGILDRLIQRNVVAKVDDNSYRRKES